MSEDQKIVLNWFKERKTKSFIIDVYPFNTVRGFNEPEIPKNVNLAILNLTEREQFEVLKSFVEWGLSKED